MDLYLWPGRWNLASFDPESLCVLTYVKFGGLPVNLRTHFNFNDAPDGNVPYLQHGQNISHGLKRIFEYLRKENYGIEYEFDEADLVRLNAVMKTIEVELVPAVIHTWFVNLDTFSHCTRKAYCEAVGFPHCMYLSRWLRNKAWKRVYQGHVWPSLSVTTDMIDQTIISQAKICLTSLSYLLADKKFFLGNKPSAVDAVIFGLLFPLTRAPIPHHPLVEHINQCENLTELCERIQKQYFEETTGLEELQNTKNDNNANNSNSDGNVESLFSFAGLRNVTLFGLGAILVNFLYAYASDMVEVDMEEESGKSKEG